jgi:ABC-type transport system substrate-binding protein
MSAAVQSGFANPLLANPNYWDGEVPTKHLIFSITPNVETRLAKLQTNECQIIPAPPVQFDD